MIYVMDIIQACLLGGALYSHFHGYYPTMLGLIILFIASLFVRIK